MSVYISVLSSTPKWRRR